MQNPNKSSPVTLTIAGSDSSAGAGIQADLKAFIVCDVYGASVITCVTAQNTKGVQAVEPLGTEIITAQLEAILTDLKPAAIKTGMLYSKEIVMAVVAKLKEYQELLKKSNKNQRIILVADPVMQATTGADLTSGKGQKEFDEFLSALKNSLFPLATLITPNLPEAEKLLNKEVVTEEDRRIACIKLQKLGPKYVLLKGGHFSNIDSKADYSQYATDLLYDGEFHEFKAPRINKDIHGTGCSFAALITGLLAKSIEVPHAVQQAKEIISEGIRNSISAGEGVEIINIGKILKPKIDQPPIVSAVTKAVEDLIQILNPYFVPEVGINIGYGKPNARSAQDICALTGRIIRVGNGVDVLGRAEFGVSKHVARIILACMKNDDHYRSAMNIKYRPEIIDECKKLNFSIGTFNRGNEPGDTSSMEWGTNYVIKELESVPDIIYDTGGMGKEPMIRVIGINPENVLGKVKKIIER
ncbi:MAG: bifunctional hydroxymethylpyrimidine kinase/phosphomethylpyrimidine kinase, partial [Thermoplasmata archaeon]|nr:bifunctional hydroxymethylpyrimidine kinase/phosphomethylpyrimidine kinase [Thermoplasmata archaeon]